MIIWASRWQWKHTTDTSETYLETEPTSIADELGVGAIGYLL